MILQEDDYRIDYSFFSRQPNISHRMRLILFDWMMEVCEEFQLKRDTYYMAINYVDRYMAVATYEVPKVEL